MRSLAFFVAFLGLLGQVLTLATTLQTKTFFNKALNEMHLMSDPSVAIKVRPNRLKVVKLLMTGNNAFSNQYGKLGEFVSNQLQGRIKSNYSSASKFGGHICYEFFDFIPRDKESVHIVDLFNKRKDFRRQNPDTKEDKRLNPLVTLPGAPGSGKSSFLIHFPESEAYMNYTNSSEIVFVSTITFNSVMEGGEPAFGLRVLYGFLKGMGLLPSGIKWFQFFNEYKDFKYIKASEAIELIENFAGSHAGKLEYLVLVDELSKLLSLARLAKMSNPEDVLIDTMTEIGALLSTYDNVNVVVSSLSPNFVENLATYNSRPIDYVVPKPLMGSQLGSDACKNRCNSLQELVKAADCTADATNIRIFENMYLLLSGHPRSLEEMVKALKDDTSDWEIHIQELCKEDMHFRFLEYIVDFLQNEVPTLPFLEHDTPEIISKFIFAAQPTDAKESGFRELLEGGDLQIYESSKDKFVFMSPTVSVLHWMFTSDPIVLTSSSSVHMEKLYQIQQLSRNINDLNLSDLMKYIVGITIVAHSYERRGIGAILGGASIIAKDFQDSPKFEVVFEKNIINSTDFIIPNRLYMAKEKQVGYDLRVVLQCKASDLPRHYYLQVKIRLPESEPLIKVLAKMIHNNIYHYQTECHQKGLQALYMYVYIWDIVPKDMINKEDLLIAVNSLNLKGKQNTVDFVTKYYDHLIVMDKSKLQKWILPSLLAVPDLLQQLNDTND